MAKKSVANKWPSNVVEFPANRVVRKPESIKEVTEAFSMARKMYADLSMEEVWRRIRIAEGIAERVRAPLAISVHALTLSAAKV